MNYEDVLKAAIEFKKLAQQTAGGPGEYQDLLAGHKDKYTDWSKFTGGKNLIGVNVDTKQLIPENPTIQSILAMLGDKPGAMNANIVVQTNGNVMFSVNGNHPAVKNGAMQKMMHAQLAPQMVQAVKNAVQAGAIHLPTGQLNWNWISNLEVG